MNFWAASSLIVSIASYLSGAVVFFQNPRNKKNITFLLFALSLGFWTTFYMFWQMAGTPEQALKMVRIQMMACAFIPITEYHHLLALFEINDKKRNTFLFCLYALAVLLALFGFTDSFIPRVEPRFGFPYWPVPGIAIHILFATLAVPGLGILLLIWEEKYRTSALAQNQLKWLLLAYVIGYGCGTTNCPLWYNIPIKPYPHVLISLMPIMSAFVFFKLGLYDFRFFFRRLSVYLLTGAVVGGAAGLMVWLISRNAKAAFSVLAVSFVTPPAFLALRKRIDAGLVHTLFRKGAVSLQSLNQRVASIRETTYTYDDLAKNIVSSLLNTFPVEMAAVYFFDLTRKELHLRAQTGMTNSLTANLRYNRTSLAIPEADPLMKQMDGKRDVLNLDALLESQRSVHSYQPVIATMNRIEALVCAPLLLEGRVKGMLVLGRKKDLTLYTPEDVEAISAFTRMGEEIMRYIMGMETELRHTSLYSHDMAHDVRALLQVLEFMISPMAAQQSQEKKDLLLKQARDVAMRLFEVFENNRDRSNLILRSVRGEYEREKLNLVPLLNSSVEKFRLLADGKKVMVTLSILSEPLHVQGNALDLNRVMDNLLGNALRHVPDGASIAVSAGRDADKVVVEVKDTGEGIDPDNLDKIWETGWQTGEKKGSAGLGLSIVKQVVDMHQGTIKALSQGLGTGATFRMELPLAGSPTS